MFRILLSKEHYELYYVRSAWFGKYVNTISITATLLYNICYDRRVSTLISAQSSVLTLVYAGCMFTLFTSSKFILKTMQT
jgi:hypothetical protein